MRVYNFSAGPSALPLEVIEKVQKALPNYENSGLSVMEMSHRSKVYEGINARAEALLRELMGIPDDYAVIFIQGGASMQFEAVPLNICKNKKADYVVTGVFSDKAEKEAQKYTDTKIIASSKDKNHTYIPQIDVSMIRPGADYLHICYNNTIVGTRFNSQCTILNAQCRTNSKLDNNCELRIANCELPPIVADMSSMILSEEVDVSKFGVIYAGAQKNLAPAGVTIVIVKKDLASNPNPLCPTMMRWSTQIEQSSLYNTPPAFSTYVAMEVMEWLKALGGVKAIQKINEQKADILYDFIDNSKFYSNNVQKEFRSLMNVPFKTATQELDNKFVLEATKAGLIALKGHRLVGGMRVSIYNAMPIEGIKALVEFMKGFEKSN